MNLLTLSRPGRDAITLKRGKTISTEVKAAFFYPYPTGWHFYPLAPDRVPAALNGATCGTGRPLAVGDLVRLGRMEFVVETADLDGEPETEPDEPPPPCWVSVNGGAPVTVRKQILIGSDPACRVRVPPALGAEPVHALVASAAGAWWLHDLSGHKLAREHEEPARTLVLSDGDRVGIGQAALRVHLGALDEEFAGRDTSSDNLSVAASGASTAKPTSGHSVLLAGSKIFASAEALQNDPVYAKAWDLVQWLTTQARAVPPRPAAARAGGLSGALGRLMATRPRTPLEAIAQFREQLAPDPRDRDHLRRLAQFLEAEGYPDLCRVVLKELYGLDPKDRPTLRALAVGYLNLGLDRERPADERARAFQHAEEFARKGLALDPADRVLAEVQREAGSELTILQGNLHAALRSRG